MQRFWQQIKNTYHFLQAHWWRFWYRRPDQRLTLYGVTGTNGKTTTAFVLGHILRTAQGRAKVGLLTSEVFWFGDVEEQNKTHMTSMNARLLYTFLRRMVDQKVTQVVLELTSHALDQYRLAGLALDGAIITNITHEHLDYHKTMPAYAQAKARIATYLVSDGVLVGNEDDGWVKKILQKLRAQNPKLMIIGFTKEQATELETNLPGAFNHENVLAASLLAREIGIDTAHIQQAITVIPHIPGRVEWIESPAGFRVMVDFALTPDAVERLYAYVRQEVSGRIIAVFGAAGRRDRTKRPKIAAIVARYADEIVITQDEPYTEDEEQIYAELEAGLVGTSLPWQRIEDRREALRYALGKARAGDAVIVTGMGNFSTRMVGGREIPWNDRAEILALLAP